MKVLFLLTQDLESPSGLGRYFPMAQSLTSLGHETTIVALHSNFHSLAKRDFVQDGVKVCYVGQMHVQKKANEKIYFNLLKLLGVTFQATLALTKAALKAETDIYIVGKPHPMNGIAGIIARIMKRSPLIVDCDDYETGSSNFRQAWQREVVSFFERQIPRHSDAVLSNTYFMQDNLISWGVSPKKIHYIPNGVDAGRFRQPESGEILELRSKLGLEGYKIVSFIGSLSLVNHPVDILFDAFRLIKDEYDHIKLLIVGGGEDFQTLKQLAAEYQMDSEVIFTGRVPKEQVVLYYHVSDVTVDPVYDNDAERGRSPLKLFESWYCGTPFITGDVGDRRYLLENSQAGVLVKPGDAGALADALRSVLNHADFTNDTGTIIEDRVKGFQWSQLALKLQDVIIQLSN